jgi:hypothetical protein
MYNFSLIGSTLAQRSKDLEARLESIFATSRQSHG